MLLRRRALTGPVLLLLFLCVCYMSWNRSKPQSGSQRGSAESLLDTRRLISALESAHKDAQVSHTSRSADKVLRRAVERSGPEPYPVRKSVTVLD